MTLLGDLVVPTEQEWIDEQALKELLSACEANDVARVKSLYCRPPYSGIVDFCLEDSTPNVALLRCLLEDGASPDLYAQKENITSKDTLELLAEYGHDFKLQGHLILQYFARSREIIDWMLDYGVDINRTDYRRTDEGERLAGPNDTSLKVLNGVAARGDIGLYDHLIVRGADQSRSLALHCASRCKDTEKSTAMIDHLLDRYHMDIEFDNEVLRNHFDTVGDSGTPLESAVYHQNLPAVHKLLARGAQPRPAMAGAIGHYKFMEGYLPALCPLLDAGLDLGEAFNWAVLWGNVDAAKICLERGADPTDALKKQRAREARLDAERNSSTEMVNQNSEDERLPRGEISPEMEDFLRSIRTRESFCE